MRRAVRRRRGCACGAGDLCRWWIWLLLVRQRRWRLCGRLLQPASSFPTEIAHEAHEHEICCPTASGQHRRCRRMTGQPGAETVDTRGGTVLAGWTQAQVTSNEDTRDGRNMGTVLSYPISCCAPTLVSRVRADSHLWAGSRRCRRTGATGCRGPRQRQRRECALIGRPAISGGTPSAQARVCV